MSEPAVEAQALTKHYGSHRGIVEIDLTVERGEVFGFLGPNGAGKSTTIRLMLDLIRPTSGTIRVLGQPPASGPELRRRLGYLPGELMLEGRQTVHDLLHFFGRLSGGVPSARIAELADRLGLDPTRQVRGLSKGNKQKVGIVQAFMHQPDLLILDEPTSGLDPIVQQEFLALVREARDVGQTVFMSSHIMSEVEGAADRVAIVREGRIVLVSAIKDLTRVRRLEVDFTDAVPIADFARLPGVGELHVDGHRLTCTVQGEVDPVLKALARHHVHSLRAVEPDLEALFLTYYATDTASVSRTREVSHAG